MILEAFSSPEAVPFPLLASCVPVRVRVPRVLGSALADAVNHQPEAEPEQGRQRFEEAVKGVMRAVPDSQWTVSDLLADGDRVAARTTWSVLIKRRSSGG